MAKRARAAPQQRQAPARGGKRRKQRVDVYEAEDSDPEEEKHADRYDRVENYEYELPSDFDDEEIDEDMAFTAEDKERYAGWFDDGAGAAAAGARGRGKGRDEFADLDSSEEGAGEEGSEHESDLDFEDGGDLLAALDGGAAPLGSDGGEEGGGGGFGGGGDEDEDDLLGGSSGGEDDEEEGGVGDDDDDEEGYKDMLAAALGRAGAPGERRKRGARAPRVVSEAYPESEFHAAASAGAGGGGGGGELRLADLMAGLGDAKGRLGASRKVLERLERRGAPVEAPLPRAVRERQERKAGYEETSKDVTKWQPMVKANREAPTLRFTSARHEVPDRGASTQALLEGFKPEGDMEAEVAALLQKAGAAGSKAMAEAERALAEQTLTPEEHKERAARLAKMRNVLFYAEQKAKRLAKIKSKEYHRRANKAAKRAAARALDGGGAAGVEAGGGGGGGDDADEAARRAAREEAEFERARERLTLKHRNTSRWARRALKRGVDVMDAGTKAALAEQMALGVALRRKIDGRSSGSDGSGGGGSTSASEGEGEGGGGGGGGGARGGAGLMSERSRREAVAILQGLAAPPGEGGDGADGGGAKAGLFALPFMKRALEKQRAAAAAEAAELIRELEGGGGDAEEDLLASGGRLRFGGGGGGGGGGAKGGRQREEEEEDGEGEGSDDDEDAEAKAERLGRRLRGEPEAAAGGGGGGGGAAGGSRKGGGGEEAAGEMPARGLRRGAVAAATEGPVDVDMGGAEAGQQQQRGAAAAGGGGKASRQQRKAAAGDAAAEAALRAASQHNAAAGAHDWLFDGAGAGAGTTAAQRRKQRRADGGGAGGGGAEAAFVTAKAYGGAREGYVFQRGPQGVGYYLDPAAAAPKAAANGGAAAGAHAVAGGGKQQQAKGGGRAGGGAGQVAARQEASSGGDSSDGEERGGGAAAAANGNQQQKQQQKQQRGANGAAAGGGGGGSDDDGERAHHMAPLAGDADAQRALLRRAFAADDVAAEFAAEKAAEVEEQLPKEDAPGLMPGWGLWAGQQREPKWMAEARAKAARKKEAAAAARQDARLAHVVISEKWDKKAAKYGAAALPFPFKSADAYEHSIRQPLGRDVNPDAAFRNLTRPAVLKSAGVVIDPLRYSKGLAEYGATKGAKARGVVTVAGGVPLQGQGPGGGAGPGAAGGAKKKGGGGGGAKKGGGGGGKGGGRR